MSRKPSLRDALDASLDRLARGESISQCLYPYPQYERDLLPLLEAALVLRRGPVPEASPEAREEGYARMMAAVRAKRRRDADRARRGRKSGGLLSVVRSRSSARWLVMSGAAIVTLLLVGFAWLWQAGQLSTMLLRPVQAVIAEADGIVLRLPTGSRIWVPVDVGAIVAPGDRLQTGQGGYALVEVGHGHSVGLQGGAEVSFVAVPTRWAPARAPLIYQAQGDVRYNVAADAQTQSKGGAVVAAAGVAGDNDGDGRMAATFEVQSPILAVVAEAAQFMVSVATDGATSVTVADGQVTVSAGNQVMVAAAGQTAYLGAGEWAMLGLVEGKPPAGDGGAAPAPTEEAGSELPLSGPDTNDGLPPSQVPQDPGATITPVPGNEDAVPGDAPEATAPGAAAPGATAPDPSTTVEPADDKVSPDPPSSDKKDVPGVPPGLINPLPDNDAPGLEDKVKDGEPPGLGNKDKGN